MAQVNIIIGVLFLSIIIINGQLNCSTYNPCSPNGYCHDNSDGGWTCECKFWWNGTTCNQQTNSGTQVIVLGCLLALLLTVFYGLKIARSIRIRRQKPKEIDKKEIIQDPTLFHIGLKSARRLARISSCITSFLLIILTITALLSEWVIIQPIHNDIVTKFRTNQPIYYEQNSICNIMHLQEFNVLSFPVACLLILIFIIRTKRISFLRDKCYGYGAPPMPMDFLSHIDRKFAGVVFAICADELITILKDAFNGNSKTGQGVLVTFLSRLLQVLIMGFHYYPFLAAVYINSILTLTCGTLYAWLDYSTTIINQGMCQSDFYPTLSDYQSNSSSIVEMFEYFGTGPNLVTIVLIKDIPRFLCLSYISVKIPILLIRKIYNRFRKDLSIEKKMLMKLTREENSFLHISNPNSIEMLYVKNLFRSSDKRPRSHALLARLIPKFIYEWRDDFRFSTRVICVYSTISLLLYFITIQACIQVLPILHSFQTSLQTILDVILQLFFPLPGNVVNSNNGEENANTSDFPLPPLVRSYLLAMCMTLIVIITQLLVLLVNIRRNLFQSFRGDDSEIPRRVKSQYVSYSSGNVHFGGYFLGYLIWGFIIVAMLSVIFWACIDAFFTFGGVRFLEKILKAIIPTILFILFKQYLNRLLAQYVFLQHSGDVLALNNRRVLMIFIYFNFFLDAFLGFISSIMRLVKIFIYGLIYMCRLDYSPLGRKLETSDGGFSAYIAFIHTECAHRHPVMLVFVSHLYTQVKMKHLIMDKITIRGENSILKAKPSSRYFRKWQLAVFLIRNPTIVFFRKSFFNQLHIEDVRALNDIDDDKNKDNMQRRLSIYTRRMSAARLSVSSTSVYQHFDERRF